MRLTPLDIQNQKFRKTALGYDTRQVDAFLDAIRLEWEFLYQELHKNEEEVEVLENILAELRSRENALKDALLVAQKTAESIRSQAERESEIVLSQASTQSDKMLKQAYHRLATVIDDIKAAKKQKAEFQSKLRGLIEMHLHLLDEQVRDDEKSIEHVTYLSRDIARA